MDRHYHERQGNKWIVMLFGFFIFGTLGILAMPYMSMTVNPNFNRVGYEGIAEWKLGSKKYGNETYFPEILIEEMLIVAYDYNLHEPRIFSKFAIGLNPVLYNVTITEAAKASGSAPIFFKPMKIGD
jgi:hypothetical protein